MLKRKFYDSWCRHSFTVAFNMMIIIVLTSGIAYGNWIVNGSFEQPDVADGVYDYTIPNWTITGSPSILDPTDNTFSGTTGDNTQGVLPDGGQTLFLGSTSSITQYVGVQAANSTLYQLSFSAGQPSYYSWPGVDYKVELLAGDTVLQEWTNPANPGAAGTFATTDLSFFNSTSVSGELGVRFTGINAMSGETYIDNVSLTAQTNLYPYPILDSSFERQNISERLYFSYSWETSPQYWGCSICDPWSSLVPGTDGDDIQGILPDGGQMGLIENTAVIGGGGDCTTLSQTIDAVATPGAEYQLEFYVGARGLDGWPSAEGLPTNYNVTLCAGDTTILSVANPVTPEHGSFEKVVLTGTAPEGISGELTIKFEVADSNVASQTFFDAVALYSDTPVTHAASGMPKPTGVPASATDIYIEDFSFERSRALPDGYVGPSDTWESGPAQDGQVVYGYFFDPTDAQFAGCSGDDTQGGFGDGGQVGIIESGTDAYPEGNCLSQILEDEVIANAAYYLSFYAGDRADWKINDQDVDPNYMVEILAGDEVIYSSINPTTHETQGEIEQVLLSFTAPSDAEGLLGVRFSPIAGDTPNQTFIDAVQLYVDALPQIPGDANKDGKVDGSDVTILAGNWQFGVDGNGSATWDMGDFNGDGKVDGSDVTILAGNWQYGVEASSTSVPEPTALILLIGMTASVLLIRRP